MRSSASPTDSNRHRARPCLEAGSDPPTDRACRLLDGGMRRVDHLDRWLIRISLCAEPTVEAEVIGDEGVVAPAPPWPFPNPPFEFRVVARERRVVYCRETATGRARLHQRRNHGSAEDNRSPSLVDIDDQPQPDVPVPAESLGPGRVNHAPENIAFEHDAIRQGVHQTPACRCLAPTARTSHHEHGEPSEWLARTTGCADRRSPPRLAVPDLKCGIERAACRTNVEHPVTPRHTGPPQVGSIVSSGTERPPASGQSLSPPRRLTHACQCPHPPDRDRFVAFSRCHPVRAE